MGIDKLAAIIRIETQQRKGEPHFDLFEGGKYPNLGLVFYRPDLCPPRADVGKVKSLNENTARISSFVGDQIHLHKPWLFFIPLTEGSDQNLML
jgi:hypothetical protein